MLILHLFDVGVYAQWALPSLSKRLNGNQELTWNFWTRGRKQRIHSAVHAWRGALLMRKSPSSYARMQTPEVLALRTLNFLVISLRVVEVGNRGSVPVNVGPAGAENATHTHFRHAHPHTHTYIHTYVRTNGHAISTHKCKHTYTRTHVHAYTHTYTDPYVHSRIHLPTHTHTHSKKYTHAYRSARVHNAYWR